MATKMKSRIVEMPYHAMILERTAGNFILQMLVSNMMEKRKLLIRVPHSTIVTSCNTHQGAYSNDTVYQVGVSLVTGMVRLMIARYSPK